MTAPGTADPPRTARELALLALCVLACLLPFAGKAPHIDDTLFIYLAQQIRHAPTDFFGATVNWHGIRQPFSEVTKNPPLAGYYLALATALGGESVAVLHVAMMLPALAAVWGTYFLARRWCSRPVWAAAYAWLSPLLIVSSTSLMCDVMMLALWCWTIECWHRARERRSLHLELLAGLLLVAAVVTKYMALALVPLWLADDWLARRATRLAGTSSPRLRLPWLGLATALLLVVAFEGYCQYRYGRGMIGEAARYVAWSRGRPKLADWDRWYASTIYLGGCLLPTLGLAPWLWSARQLGAMALAAAAAVLSVLALLQSRGTDLQHVTGVDWIAAAHSLVFALAAVQIAMLAVTDVRRRRDQSAWFLALWLAGVWVFTAGVNWTVNARTLLPAAPVVGMLLMRRLADASHAPPDDPTSPDLRSREATFALRWAASLAVAISLLVAWGDAALANAHRAAAQRILRQIPTGERIWFAGHWGFQHALETGGGVALDVQHDRPAAGDWLVMSRTADNQTPPAALEAVLLDTINEPVPASICTLSAVLHTNWYSLSALPWRITRVPIEQYFVFRVVGWNAKGTPTP